MAPLAIARDDGNGGATVKQFNGRFGLFTDNGNVSCKSHDQGFGRRENQSVTSGGAQRSGQPDLASDDNERVTRLKIQCLAS